MDALGGQLKISQVDGWRIEAEAPEIQCVAFTVLERPQTVFEALRAGAAGYLLKGCSLEELAQSLRSLESGGVPLTPKIARLLVEQFPTKNWE